jgi:16S rRNA processing protein RimM
VENDRFLPVGKIVGAHGLMGNIRVHFFAESAELFEPGCRILVKTDADLETMYEIDWAKPHSRNVLMSLKGIDNRHSAESLVGSELFFEKSMLPELEAGTYYWEDIIGLAVYTTGGTYLGKVESIIETGSNDVYVVSDQNQEPRKEILVPALESVVLEIDINSRIMRVDLPEGL